LNNDGHYSISYSDLGEATLKIVGVTTEDDGIYTCIAVNDMGSASSSASLRVLAHLQSGEPQFRCSVAACGCHIGQRRPIDFFPKKRT